MSTVTRQELVNLNPNSVPLLLHCFHPLKTPLLAAVVGDRVLGIMVGSDDGLSVTVTVASSYIFLILSKSFFNSLFSEIFSIRETLRITRNSRIKTDAIAMTMLSFFPV